MTKNQNFGYLPKKQMKMDAMDGVRLTHDTCMNVKHGWVFMEIWQKENKEGKKNIRNIIKIYTLV